jgi:hypothetical protein
MAILGPTFGFATYLALVVHAAQTLAQPAPSFSEAVAHLQQVPVRLALCLLPLGLGILCGATGLVIVIANLAIHFLGQPATPAASSGAYTERTPAPQSPGLARVLPAVQDDSRYMPKFR